jgi:hypothetical protein
MLMMKASGFQCFAMLSRGWRGELALLDEQLGQNIASGPRVGYAVGR